MSSAIVARAAGGLLADRGVRERRGRHTGYRLVYVLRRRAGPGRTVEAEMKAERFEAAQTRASKEDVGVQYRFAKISKMKIRAQRVVGVPCSGAPGQRSLIGWLDACGRVGGARRWSHHAQMAAHMLSLTTDKVYRWGRGLGGREGL